MLAWMRSLAAAVLAIPLVSASAWAAPADLDRSFGNGGHVIVQGNAACPRNCVELAGSYADALAVQPDGGIVLGGSDDYIGAGRPRSGEAPGALVRLLPSGALDSSFGAGGIENTPFRVDQIDSNAIGGLDVMGRTVGGRGGGKLGLARYTAAGVLDGTFAPQGVRWIPQPTGWREEQRDARGRVVVLAPLSPLAAAVVRYLPSGALDPSFGHNGFAGVHVPQTHREAAMPPGSVYPPEVTPTAFADGRDGRVLVAFAVASREPTRYVSYGPPRYFLERLTASGHLDHAFGGDGLVRLAQEATLIAVAPSGHILLASAEPTGRRREPEEPTYQRRGFESGRLLLASYTPSGHLDRAFGDRGVARSRPIAGQYQVGIAPEAIAFDAEGDAIVVGELRKHTIDTPAGTGFLARYTAHGRDCSFGTHGVVIDDGMGGASAVAIQPDGRIVVAGWSNKAFGAARYMGGGSPRTCAGEGARRRAR